MEGGSILFLQNTGYLSAHKFQVGGLSPSYHHWSPEEGVRAFAHQCNLYVIPPIPSPCQLPCHVLALLCDCCQPTRRSNQCQGEAGKRGVSPCWLCRPQLKGKTRLPQVVSNITKRSYNEFFCCRNVSAWDLARADFENGVISLPVADAAWSGRNPENIVSWSRGV